jgi:acetyl-CoA C-acetyltransferase
MPQSVILSAVRLPTGKFLGSLKSLTAPELGALVVREAVARAGVEPARVDECIMGNVVSAGLGQNPARQAALGGGLDDRVNAFTVNQVCGSGLKAVMLATQSLAAGDSDLVVAGGMESMSNAPHLIRNTREGLRLGQGQLVDSVIHDGLWCAFENWHMGMTGEAVAERYGVSREDQDCFAAESHRRATAAQTDGAFTDEILPVCIVQRKGAPVVVDRDEAVRTDTTAGARILTTLLYAMRRRGVRRGVAALCLGGGNGVALAIELDT